MSRHLLHHQHVQQLIESHTDFVSVVIIDIKGSAPQEPGAKMLVTADSTNSPFEGTIGGGKLELWVIKHAQKMLAAKHNDTQTITLNLQSDVGMTCGGVVQLFFEAYHHDHWHIAVFGAGHVAQALVPLLLTLSCRVHCFDTRSNWLAKLPEHPALNKVKLEHWSAVSNQLPESCYLVSVTQGHCEDVDIMAKLLSERKPPYVGIIGSDSKAVLLKKELKAQGLDATLVDAIHCPIGLSLGDDIPAEIAVSITAQLLQHRDAHC